MPPKINFPNPDQLVALYLSGTSINQLSNKLGYGRPAVTRFLRERGVPLRSQSESELVKWERLKHDPVAVRRQLSAAWKASRNRTDSTISKERRALGVFKTAAKQGAYDLRIATLLAVYSWDVSLQVAVGIYNVDLAIGKPRVAVEIQCSRHRHPQSSLAPKRIEYILDRGWSVLIVYVRQHAVPDLPRVAEKIHSFFQLASRDPSLVGQYGVIGRDGQPVTPRGMDYPDRPRVKGF